VILEKAALEDIALMHAYAAKLEKQDREREEAFAKTVRTASMNTGAAAKIKEKEWAKERALEATIERYHHSKLEADAMRERREKAKRAQDVVDRKRTLKKQVDGMAVIADKEREQERKFAAQFEADRVASEQEESAKQRRIRNKNVANQKLLVKQREAACIIQSHPDFPGMSDYEAALNRRIIGTILKDPDSKRQIENAMSSSSLAEKEPAKFSNVF
jgi:hypothetical protein